MWSWMMKILFYAWTIYDESLDEMPIKPNGGSIAIKNICEYVGRKCDVYLFLGKNKMHYKKLGSINIVDTFHFQDYIDRELDQNECRLRTMLNAFEETVKKVKPDIINLHGGGELTRRCLMKCIQMNWIYALTDHLYIGLEKKVPGYDMSVEWEKQVFKIRGIKITTVSSAMKRNILRDYHEIKEKDVKVILNGTDFTYEKFDCDLKEQYHLNGKKILLCIGSIRERKNQIQLVHAFSRIKEGMRENLTVIFCGNDKMDGALQTEIKKYHLEQSMIYVGVVPNSCMKQYYSIADGYILPSIAEGLSLTMLEAMVFGLPLIMFHDLEGASDLNDKQVVQFICGKTEQDMADAIIQWSSKCWDNEYIRKFADYFTMERVADDYIEYYKERIACQTI